MSKRKANRELLRLLQMPSSARAAAAWEAEFERWLPQGSFEGLGGRFAPGPRGYACLHLCVGGGGVSFPDALDVAVEGAAGMVIAPGLDTPVEISFGLLATYRMFGALRTPPGWNGGSAELGPGILTKEEPVLTGPPNEDYLPTFVWRALRAHLESVGISDPRVLLVMWPERGDHRDLCFNIERTAFSSADDYGAFMKSLVWFLPDGYTILDSDSQQLVAAFAAAGL